MDVELYENPFIRAYIQGDWVAADACAATEEMHPKLRSGYDEFLLHLRYCGVANEATWHTSAVGCLGAADKPRSQDALRNIREVHNSDVVITRLVQEDPEAHHWGSIGIMCYALGLGKPCYVLASPTNRVWRHHLMHHPLVRRVESVEELVAILRN